MLHVIFVSIAIFMEQRTFSSIADGDINVFAYRYFNFCFARSGVCINGILRNRAVFVAGFYVGHSGPVLVLFLT